MKQQSFTAQELFCMARLSGKRVIYGIPDGFALVPQEELQGEVQRVTDSLCDKGIATMDFDGKITVSEEYSELLRSCCDCGKCLTVNLKKKDGTEENDIFWILDGVFLMAEVIGERYVFSSTDTSFVKELFFGIDFPAGDSSHASETVILLRKLTEAKRACTQGKTDDATRILRQNGADERLACVIADGLCEKAGYVGLLLMENSGGNCKKTERYFLHSRGLILALSQTVVNLRTCCSFKEQGGDVAGAEVSALLDAFLRK